MVEVQGAHVAGIATYAAASAGLAYEDRLHLSASASHGVRPAALAAVRPTCVKPELRFAVTSTRHPHGGKTSLLRSASLLPGLLPACAMRLESVPHQPMPHRSPCCARPWPRSRRSTLQPPRAAPGPPCECRLERGADHDSPPPAHACGPNRPPSLRGVPGDGRSLPGTFRDAGRTRAMSDPCTHCPQGLGRNGTKMRPCSCQLCASSVSCRSKRERIAPTRATPAQRQLQRTRPPTPRPTPQAPARWPDRTQA